ncbi:MAG: 2-oxo acid dehydrogenase subunit E2 [Oscillospiraceae bacterium]|nr:2-oxo acid dehydrogenase subunit E2 [Oscillospiraceae bacterium]
MAETVIMPRQGQSVESCLITKINKKKGDNVNIGDILFSYETDKSSFDEESKAAGTVLALFVEEGDDVPCLDTVMIIGKDGEDISGLMPQNSNKSEKPAEIEQSVRADGPVRPSETRVVSTSTIGDLKISPRAKHYAEQAKVDFNKAFPTGPNGRIIERDIIELVKKGERFNNQSESSESNVSVREIDALLKNLSTTDESTNEYADVKLPNIRKIIAKSMHASLSEMAQLTLNSSFDASVILSFRKRLKENTEYADNIGLVSITLNDIILYATAKTLMNHKDANAHFLGDIIRYFNTVNLGVAVDTERGLVVPTIFGADKLSLNELSKEAKKIIWEVQKGTISPDKLKNGTFTVTNLGSLGIESFTPVINPPQTCILGVNNITRRIKQINGQDVFYDCMSLSLTFDHRALDGAPAARFLKELCANLENFDLLLAK